MQKVLFVGASPTLRLREQLLTFLVLLLSEEDENKASPSTDDERQDQRASFANAAVCVAHYSRSAQYEGALVNADAFVHTLQPPAFLHSTDCHSTYGLPSSFGIRKCFTLRNACSLKACSSEINDKVLFDFIDCKASF